MSREELLKTYNSETLRAPLHVSRDDPDYFAGLFSVEALLRLLQSYRHTWEVDIKLVREGITVRPLPNALLLFSLPLALYFYTKKTDKPSFVADGSLLG